MFQVIRLRLFPNKATLKPLWNTFPGALVMRPQYSMDPKDFPFFYSKLGIVEEKFTAVIYSTTSVLKDSSALSRLIKNVGKSKFIAKVIKTTYQIFSFQAGVTISSVKKIPFDHWKISCSCPKLDLYPHTWINN